MPNDVNISNVFREQQTKAAEKLLSPTFLAKVEKVASTCDRAREVSVNLLDQLTKIIKLRTSSSEQGVAAASAHSVMYVEAAALQKTVANLEEICGALPGAITEMQELRSEIQEYLQPKLGVKATLSIGNEEERENEQE